MSKLLISQYHSEVAKVIQYGGSRNEENISNLFGNLLNEYCKTRDFLLIPQLPYKSERIKPDGTIRDALALDWGYWESKDEYDDLDREIEKKLGKGYPNDNILFEDSQTAVLIQSGQEKMRVSMANIDALDKLLKEFVEYQRPEVAEFYQAIEQFKKDLPTILETLRDKIDLASKNNPLFVEKKDIFLKLCQDSINPNVTVEDIREMMIQHILTEDIFLTIFDEASFHRDNNIARQLTDLINTFLKGASRKQLLSTIQHYYIVIKRKASQINNHHDKQKFLKAIYENFYKAYNPLAADRLGIVYTPNEIVRFMIESTDYLLEKHFNKLLADPDIEILDPATGTGTFITELIEYLPQNKLKYKYQNEIHCNEVAILPYYIANLNIEYTYQQKMGEYEEFTNICFVDTLDHTSFYGKQGDLFAMSLENTERIKRQNDKKISVIIGNPPYNANQQNENDNNKNRSYPAIDTRIKATYVKESTAQKTKVYDMYSRFFRWASDRLGENGIIAFVTNSSFINARTFDGFRKLASQEFSEIYIIDLDGDVRKNPKISGTIHNVFGIQTGVAISFLIKKAKKDKTPCKIFYTCRPDTELAIDKLKFLSAHKIYQMDFDHVIPDHNNNWVNLADNDFDKLLLLVDRENKKSVFKLNNPGISTNRDLWVYDLEKIDLINKIKHMIESYNNLLKENNNNYPDILKWSHVLKKKFTRQIILNFSLEKITQAYYRPFHKVFYYSDLDLSDLLTDLHFVTYGEHLKQNNVVINFTGPNSQKPFMVLANNYVSDLHFVGAASATQCLPLYTYDKEENRIDNITDWGLEQFREHYNRLEACYTREIEKIDIFHYVYGVLHHPAYRQKYELNLKRDFPRIPFYENFYQWVEWGEKLMELHLNYETITPYPLRQIDIPLKNEQTPIKPKLKADKTKNQIILDEVTTLTNIPPLAWQYKLGNRSALEWILDQYKEKKPTDPTIAQKFNTYRFADYKETVINLLKRVTTVSLETMNIIQEMNSLTHKD